MGRLDYLTAFLVSIVLTRESFINRDSVFFTTYV